MIRSLFRRFTQSPPVVDERKARVNSMTALEDHVGHRRSDCWWDPIYNPELDGKLKACDWNFSDNSGPLGQFIYGPSLNEKVTPGDTFKLERLTFKDCDFQGRFDPNTLIMFDQCTFVGCDFAYSHWKDTHFRNCIFEKCSISLASFERCEFRNNNWIRIGISGSKTDFVKTFITNPDKLARASFSGTRKSDKTLNHKMFQWFRLQGTKAHLARTILLSHETVGDDGTFYLSAKTHDLQESYSKISKDIYGIFFNKGILKISSTFSLFVNLIENIILRFFGFTNGWGSSSTRPFLTLSGLFIIFGFLYSKLPPSFDITNPWQKSFNITTLVGYGNEYSDKVPYELCYIQNIHTILAIFIYTIFFGTIISRLSRVR